MTEPSTLHFQFRHALFPVNVEIKNDVLCVRYAIKYFEIPIPSLRYIYVDDDVNREMRELILCFKNKKGKLQRARVFSDREQPSFDDLVQTLSLRVGDGHLTGIDRRLAYDIMGSQSLEHIVLPMLVFGAVLFAALMLSPRLIHGLDDTTPQLINLRRLETSSLESHHVEIRNAHVDLINAIFEPTTPTEERPLEGQWHPIFASDGARGEIKLLGYFHEGLGSPVQNPPILTGLIRNIGLERIPAQITKGMQAQGVALAEDAVYLDVGATPRNDLHFFLLVMGPLSLVACFIVAAMRRAKPSAPTKPPSASPDD